MTELNSQLQVFVGQKFSKVKKTIQKIYPKRNIITYEGGFPGNYPGDVIVLIGPFGKIQTIRIDE